MISIVANLEKDGHGWLVGIENVTTRSQFCTTVILVMEDFKMR